jgi:16S rRNA processing protein RimM
MPGMGNHTGTLVKPHGYKGEMLLKGKPEILQQLTEGTPLFIETDGQRVPFFIEEVHNELPSDKVIIKFEFIDSSETAMRYVSCEVYSDPEPSARTVTGTQMQLPDYEGFRCTDRSSGAELTVTGYIDSNENPILVLAYKGNEVLLPANADYILNIDRDAGTIEAEFPEGLLDLE